jgi:hypothetical protein
MEEGVEEIDVGREDLEGCDIGTVEEEKRRE